MCEYECKGKQEIQTCSRSKINISLGKGGKSKFEVGKTQQEAKKSVYDGNPSFLTINCAHSSLECKINASNHGSSRYPRAHAGQASLMQPDRHVGACHSPGNPVHPSIYHQSKPKRKKERKEGEGKKKKNRAPAACCGLVIELARETLHMLRETSQNIPTDHLPTS